MLEFVWSFVGSGVSLPRPLLKSVWSFIGWGDYSTPYARIFQVFCRLGRLSYPPHARMSHVFRRFGRLSYPCHARISHWKTLLPVPCSNLSRLSSDGEPLARPKFEFLTSFVGWGYSSVSALEFLTKPFHGGKR